MSKRNQARLALAAAAVFAIFAVVFFAVAADYHGRIADDSRLDSIRQSAANDGGCADQPDPEACDQQVFNNTLAGHDRREEADVLPGGYVSTGFAVVSLALLVPISRRSRDSEERGRDG